MTFILNAGQGWVGSPVRALRNGNRRPVALPDAITLVQDSAPVLLAVLANDYDPEEGPLTLVSANAALGTAEPAPDGRAAYVPPAGYVGPDTITYTVADEQGLTRNSQVAITVQSTGLSVGTTIDNRLEVSAELGPVEVAVTEPAGRAGTYQGATYDLASGPVSLAPPKVQGTLAEGQVLTATDGLWIHETGAGVPVQGWQWQRGGVDIPGATGASHTVVAADIGQALSAIETLTDARGTRSAGSLPVGSSFLPSDDAQLLGWWDAADGATITASGSLVSSWADKAGGTALTQAFAPQQPETGVRSLNGLNVLDFDGGRLLEAARSFPASGDVAFHMALEIDAVSNLDEAVLAVEAANDFQIDAGSSLFFAGRFNASGIGTSATLSGGPHSGALILSVILDRTGAGTAEVFVGDISRSSSAYTADLDASAVLHLMANRAKNAWLNGAVAEVAITGDVSNRHAYLAYLQTKWGIA